MTVAEITSAGLCECGCGHETPRRFVNGHNNRKSPVAFVVDPESGCWDWQRATEHGYGLKYVNGRTVKAHRYFYEHFNGPIPDGLTLDHLCRNRGCVNPSHMEPVTQRENTLRGETLPAVNSRKTHCPRGHAYDAENTYVSRGKRHCRACRRMSRQRTQGAA